MITTVAVRRHLKANCTTFQISGSVNGFTKYTATKTKYRTRMDANKSVRLHLTYDFI